MGLLRFLLALSVIIAHSGPILGTPLIGGEVAVQTFYIISGFYMGMVLTEKYVGVNASYKLFLTNRLLRLYPIYWVMLIISVTLSLVAYYKMGPEASAKMAVYIDALSTGKMNIFTFLGLCFSNIFIVFQDWFMFLKLNVATGGVTFAKDFHEAKNPMYAFIFLPQAWTLGVEITFYLIAPFLVRRRSYILIILLIISVILRIILYQNGLKDDPWSYRFFPNEVAFFLIGILAYRAFAVVKKVNDSKFKFVISNLGLPVVILFTIFYSFINIPFLRFIYPLTIALFIPFIFDKYKNKKWDNWIGELSYPIYISHITVNILLQKLPIPDIAKGSISLAICSVVFSMLLNETISKRIEKFRQKRIKKRKANIA